MQWVNPGAESDPKAHPLAINFIHNSLKGTAKVCMRRRGMTVTISSKIQ